jgi:UDP-glucose 4-epimerase
MTIDSTDRSILVTGAGGYIGRETVRALASLRDKFHCVVALDVRPISDGCRQGGIVCETEDVRSPRLREILRQHRVDTVVHLAAIVASGGPRLRSFEHSIDVLGTKNVLDSCLETGVRQIIVTSSGAAYGYRADNPCPLSEDAPLRGNPEFAYSDHKRLVEEMLARYRVEHPELRQLIFRPGTILGERASNPITNLFQKRFVLGVLGTDSPFVFIWDQDVVQCIVKGILDRREGIYNLAGDGTLTMRQIARRLGKPYVPCPAPVLRAALRLLHALGLTIYGPEQIDFLRYRPVLSNAKLKAEFGYTPRYNSEEVFEAFLSTCKNAFPT